MRALKSEIFKRGVWHEKGVFNSLIMSNDSPVKQAFNQAQSSYDEHSSVQKLIGSFLIKSVKNNNLENSLGTVADLGCGTGFFTETLLSHFKYDLCYAVDLSNKLLEVAVTRLKNFNIRFFNQDYNIFLNSSPRLLNTIFSNMALQWSTNFESTCLKMIQALSTNGILAFSIPLNGTFKELKSYQPLFDFSMKSIENFLVSHGFYIQYQHQQTIVQTFDSALSALKSLKLSGTQSSLRKKFCEKQDSLKQLICLNQNGYSLTYQVGYVVAKRV